MRVYNALRSSVASIATARSGVTLGTGSGVVSAWCDLHAPGGARGKRVRACLLI